MSSSILKVLGRPSSQILNVFPHAGPSLMLMLFASMVSAGPLCLQMQAQSLPEVEPGHLIAYFDFHDQLGAEIQRRNSASANGGRALLDGMLGMMRISEADLSVVVAGSRALKAELATIDAESAAYKNALRQTHSSPSLQRLREFNVRRTAAVQRTISALQRNLSRAGWSAFVDDFQGRFLKSITVRRASQ